MSCYIYQNIPYAKTLISNFGCSIEPYDIDTAEWWGAGRVILQEYALGTAHEVSTTHVLEVGVQNPGSDGHQA